MFERVAQNVGNDWNVFSLILVKAEIHLNNIYLKLKLWQDNQPDTVKVPKDITLKINKSNIISVGKNDKGMTTT